MKGYRKMSAILFTTLLILLFLAATTQAQPYEITRWTVGGGGGTSNGGDYSISGTAGQLDAGNMAGGDFTLAGGFWNLETFQMIYLPLILKI
jgi:hypothetical protein